MAPGLDLQLIRSYAKGKMPASDVGHFAAAADPRCRLARAAGKARAGVKGLNTKNSSRTFRRAFKSVAPRTQTLAPTRVLLPCWDSATDTQVEKLVSIILPHELLDAIVPEGAEAAAAEFLPGQEGFQQDFEAWKSRTKPVELELPWLCVGLWGDSAPLGHRNSLYLLTMQVLNGACRKRYWLFGMTKRTICQCCGGRHTFDRLWVILAWSFQALLDGFWPHADHPFVQTGSVAAERAGKPLRFRAACLKKYGDWAWYKQILNLRGWHGDGHQKYMCWMCNANFGDNSCYMFGAGAPWRCCMETTAGMLADCQRRGHTSTIWLIPGFTLSACTPDWMHTCCLGIVQLASGSCLVELFGELGGTLENWRPACDRLLHMTEILAHELGLEKPFHTLTLTMFRRKGAKKHKLRLKAAEGRRLVPILARMLKAFSPLRAITSDCGCNALKH